jgi:hypothetical protein
MSKTIRLWLSVAFVGVIVAGYYLYRHFDLPAGRSMRVLTWLRNSPQHPEWAVQGGQRCGEAPFLLPTSGYIGYLWDDSFRIGHRHQGIDIFGGAGVGQIPVLAAYDGYLTRLPDWKSSLILRIPQDPLDPPRQIWLYYTHMADPQGNSLIDAAYPPDTNEVFVHAGTRLGYQGNYSGDPTNPAGVHLHFSIVLDDGQGRFKDERAIGNTLDPSPYFNLHLNGKTNQDIIPVCP